tara:strand:+ start:287 stop:520 length:234 start_codon:yes stop_codon:yes gene_type:complete
VLSIVFVVFAARFSIYLSLSSRFSFRGSATRRVGERRLVELAFAIPLPLLTAALSLAVHTPASPMAKLTVDVISDTT